MSETTLNLALPDSFIEVLIERMREQIEGGARSRFRDLAGTASYFGTTARQVRHWRSLGCPGVIVGRRIWFDTDLVEQWLEER